MANIHRLKCLYQIFNLHIINDVVIAVLHPKVTEKCSFLPKRECDWLKGPSWPWSYGSWIYLCNQCLSPLMWVRISIRSSCTTLCDKVCQWLATGRWFSPGPSVSSTNKTDCHDITEILLKVALNTIKQSNWLAECCFF